MYFYRLLKSFFEYIFIECLEVILNFYIVFKSKKIYIKYNFIECLEVLSNTFL